MASARAAGTSRSWQQRRREPKRWRGNCGRRMEARLAADRVRAQEREGAARRRVPETGPATMAAGRGRQATIRRQPAAAGTTARSGPGSGAGSRGTACGRRAGLQLISERCCPSCQRMSAAGPRIVDLRVGGFAAQSGHRRPRGSATRWPGSCCRCLEEFRARPHGISLSQGLRAHGRAVRGSTGPSPGASRRQPWPRPTRPGPCSTSRGRTTRRSGQAAVLAVDLPRTTAHACRHAARPRAA